MRTIMFVIVAILVMGTINGCTGNNNPVESSISTPSRVDPPITITDPKVAVVVDTLK